jgi:hypothetical protein
MSTSEPLQPSDLPVEVKTRVKRPEKSRWNKYATRLIKVEMLKQDIGYKKLAKLLAQLEPDEEEYLSETLATRVNRGTFNFALALQILRVLKVDTLSIAQLPTFSGDKARSRS